MERVVLTESIKLMELMETRKECELVYGNHGSDEADRINRLMESLNLVKQ